MTARHRARTAGPARTATRPTTQPQHNRMSQPTKRAKQKMQNIEKALHQLGIGLFTRKSSYDKPNAQQNLAGRTHYADADTLRYFKSRILRGYHRHGGLLFVVIESVGSKPYDTKRNKRAMIFDVFGTVVNDRDEWFATSAQAVKAASAFIETFNAEAWTVAELEARAAAMVRDANRVIDALEGREAA